MEHKARKLLWVGIVIIGIAVLLSGYMLWSLRNVGIKNVSVSPSIAYEEYNDMVRVVSPQKDQVVRSPLIVTGEARGVWYFEASFPLILTDTDGNVLAEGFATADDDWMTEEYVSFQGELIFEIPDLIEEGILILKKDNPSGLPENDDSFEVFVDFNSM